MKLRDCKITVQCSVCKKKYSFFVNEEDYEEYLDQIVNQRQARSAIEFFPHLMNEEIDLLETNICSDCA